MVEEKGLPGEVADRIGGYVKLRGGQELLERLERDQRLAGVKDAQIGISEMRLLLLYCDRFGVMDNVRVCVSVCLSVHTPSCVQVSFDLSLARGLDYYTGVIYEAILTGQTNLVCVYLPLPLSLCPLLSRGPQ